MQPVRDVSKWVQAARELYYQIHKGIERNQAFQKIVDGWDVMEKLDFENWLKFYEQGAQNKYKQAQVNYWGDQNNLGYYLPITPERKPDMSPVLDVKPLQNPTQHPDILQEERRQTIEAQRQKILSRLDSAKRELSKTEGHQLVGPEFESIIDALLQLEKKIRTVNKISTSVRLYQDMIIREANILSGRGFKKAADFMTKIAQAVPSAAEPSNPVQIGEGQAGSVPGQSVGQVPPDNQPPVPISVDTQQQGAPPGMPPTSDAEKTLSPGMKEFLAGLNDTPIAADNLEVDEGDSDDFVVEAQAIGPDGLPQEPVAEVEEPQDDPEVEAGKDFDQILDQSFAGATVADAVSQLENIAKIFRNREIVRQLSVADIILNQLGLASLFPTLAEITQKNLENNNYSLSRLEDILSKLRGTLTVKEIDLQHDGVQPVGQDALLAKQQLENAAEKEKARKQMRKELEEQKLEAPKPTPQVEMQSDLSQPAAIAPTPAPAITPPVRPAV